MAENQAPAIVRVCTSQKPLPVVSPVSDRYELSSFTESGKLSNVRTFSSLDFFKPLNFPASLKAIQNIYLRDTVGQVDKNAPPVSSVETGD